jgi:hypothetical protein
MKSKSDSTRFIFQWANSFLQDRFYTSVNIDPMLISSTNKTLLTTLVPDQLLNEQENEKTTYGWATDESGSNALLDLSFLPLSPSANNQNNSEGVQGLNDLMGLDLTISELIEGGPSHDPDATTTTSSWMDSELMELNEETLPSAVTTGISHDWLAQLNNATPTVPPTTASSDDFTVLAPTMSSGFELLETTPTGDDLGWSSNLTNDEVIVMETVKPIPQTKAKSHDLITQQALHYLNKLPSLHYMTANTVLT